MRGIELKDYELIIPHDEEMDRKAADFFNKDIPQMGFDSLDKLAAFVYYIRKYADEYLGIIANVIIEEDEEGEE